VNEVILSEQDQIYEGLSSNFFCVKEGVVWTAPEGSVLKGTVRGVVQELCQTEGIPLRQEFPLVSEARLWEGAFITSTSRLVLPVATVRFPESQ